MKPEKNKWKLSLSLIAVLMLSLPLSGKETTPSIPKFSGAYNTAQIRNLWMGCSNAILKIDPYSQTRIQYCDCSVDTFREDYRDPSYFDNMTIQKNRELSTVLKLSCNEWRLK